MQVVIIDYGCGNLHSIDKEVERVAPQIRVTVSADPKVVAAADRVILPGVGAIADCMTSLEAQGLLPVVRATAVDKPFLGICLGMQALFAHSEENAGIEGLGLIPGTVRRFPVSALKVPHMGWNQVEQTRPHPLWANIPNASRFYFVHSYYAPLGDACVGQTDYGLPFAAAVAQGSLFAVQFHPEKSQQAGLQLLTNFVTWQP